MGTRHPDIVWIFCDELRADAVGCYGNEHARIETPHIDSIAESGIRYERFFVDSPVCVSSRASYLSGLVPTRTGVYHNHGAGIGALVAVRSFIERLRDAGYFTVYLGKEHVPAELRGFEVSRPEGADQLDLMLRAGAMRERLGPITEGVSMNAATWPADEAFPPDMLTPEPWASRYDDQPWPGRLRPERRAVRLRTHLRPDPTARPHRRADRGRPVPLPRAGGLDRRPDR